ncbi:FUSC family protein [Vibrio sp. SCSIO 43140]|uniref:FUSC family protein n=1 Tax=Vibrio sp. SCSIO 43140 TaxID=2819100 RepID=UPI0020753D75|nr:FUSC family protein [Vibrio sp. SCSIO 43140]USD61645.1 FUSC family protein [Vibrio sp. SCSIO 43140]
MNSKARFATKVALGLTLAYLIPFAMGWPQASTAATTVMLIASTGSQRESFEKGTLRVLGTIVGAVVGLILVGAFAQDRFLYMFSVSIVVSFIFYFRNAYQSDPTLLMLTAVMTLMMSNGGDAEGAFLYGVDRAYMTVFGVVTYTLVGVYLFPSKAEQNLSALLQETLSIQQQTFTQISESLPGMIKPETSAAADASSSDNETEHEPTEEASPSLDELIEKLFTAQSTLEQRFSVVKKESSEIAAYLQEWRLVIHHSQKITQLLATASNARFNHNDTENYLSDFPVFIEQIDHLLQQSQQFLVSPETGETFRFKENKLKANEEKLSGSDHLTRASVLTLGYLLNRLYDNASKLAESISCIDSITKTVSFKEQLAPSQSAFLWWDAENFKTAIKVFVTYWVAGGLWIAFNPPGGYSFVIFSTIFMAVLSFMPLHPKALGFLFTFGFLFAIPAYVFILPQLELGIELALFLFIYTFVGFYLFKGPITIFFMLGMFVLGIDNTMTYHFGIILTIITLFYLVVLMIVFSHYFPFSSKAEHLFLAVRQRLFFHLYRLLLTMQNLKPTWLTRLTLALHLKTANVASKKLLLWASKVDVSYFNNNTQEQLVLYAKRCGVLMGHANNLVAAQTILKNNSLITKLRETHIDTVLPSLVEVHGKAKPDSGDHFDNAEQEYTKAEQALEAFFESLDLDQVNKNDIAGFYLFLHLKRNLYESLKNVEEASQGIDLDNLKMHRF